MRRLFHLLRHDERGVSAIEFAFLAPILATFVLGIVDLSSALSEQFRLQQAINRSLEMIQANRVSAGPGATPPNYDFLKTEVATAVGIPVSNVTLTPTRECSGAAAATYDGTCPANTDTARYLRLRATKNFSGRVYVRPVVLEVAASVRVQ